MSDVILRADGGEMTVGRRVANFVWGRWDVNLPAEVQLKEKIDKRMAEGFLYRPEGMLAGRFDIAGVRADSSQTMAVKKNGDIDYVLGTSNTEQVLDAAEKRIDGDVFFEKDITTVGLGPYVPGVDFQEDDLVDVLIWGKRLEGPVTAINVVRERGSADSWLVHFGGQPIADAEKLGSANDQIWAVIAAERREADQKLNAVSSVASAASVAAKVADRKAEDADAKAVTADSKADDALEKWRRQKDELDAFQSQQIEKNRELASETSRLAKAIDRRATGMIFLERDKTVYSTTHGMGMYMPRTNRWALVVATPPFTGTAVVDYYYSGGSVVPFPMGKADFELVEDWKSWSYRDSYYGARFDPLMDAQGRMLIKWIKVEIGDVRAAKLTVDKIDWS